MASYRKRGKAWYYRFVDAAGVKREEKGCSDKRATEELARDAESKAAKINCAAPLGLPSLLSLGLIVAPPSWIAFENEAAIKDHSDGFI